MFDTKKLTDTVEVFSAKAEQAVETGFTTAEENVKKINGYIQNDSVRTVAEAYAEASFAVARAVIDANKNVADTFRKAFAV
jgi:hypothetical protein